MQRSIVSLAMFAAVTGAVFGAEWAEGDLTVAKDDSVTLTKTSKTNSSLTLHGNFSVEPTDQEKNWGSYTVGTASTTASPIALGPDAGDDAVLSLEYVELNNANYLGDKSTWKAQVTVGENGGNGQLKIGTVKTWKQCYANLKAFTLSKNATLRSGETDFPALTIGSIAILAVDKICNYNANPLRIRFVDQTSSVNIFPATIRSFEKNNEGFFHIEDENSSIILEGGKIGKYTSMIRLKHWGGNRQQVNTILTSTSKGRLKTTGDCDLYLDAMGSNQYKIATTKIDWGHSRDTVFQSSQYDAPSDLQNYSGKLVMGVQDGLPYGTQTGNLVVRTKTTAESFSTVDLAGYSQKLNGLVLKGPSVVTNSAANDVTVTFGESNANGLAMGTFQQDNIRYEKVGSGVLTLSNATFKTLCVTGGSVSIAPGSVNVIETLALTNATLVTAAGADGATLTVGNWQMGEGSDRLMLLTEGQPSNAVTRVTATMGAEVVPLVKRDNGYLTCMTPADANGNDLEVRGGVLRMGGCACDNKYWKMIFKKSSAPSGIYTYTNANVPTFKFELTLGLGNVGLFTANGLHAFGDLALADVGTEAANLPEGSCSSKNPYVASWSTSVFRNLYDTTISDPVLGGGTATTPRTFLKHGSCSTAHYDSDTDTSWAGDYGYCVLYTNGTSKALNPDDSTTWEEIRWHEISTAPASTSYNLKRFVNNNTKNRAHPTDWELWSSANGTDWVKMDERTGQTFDTNKEGLKMNAQYAYTYNHHVPYLFESQNADWQFKTFGTISIAAGAVLDLDSIPDENIAINALSIDMTAGAGTLTKFAPAANGRLYLKNLRDSDYSSAGELKRTIVLPLEIGTVLSTENLKSWTVYVDGVRLANSEVIVKDGQLVLHTLRGMLLLFW